MKSIPYWRKAFKKARHKRSRARVSHWWVSLATGEVSKYFTKDGQSHNPNNAWPVFVRDDWQKRGLMKGMGGDCM